MIVVYSLLSLTCKCIAETIALSLYSADAHYTSYLSSIFGSGIAYHVYRLDVFRHKVAELGVVVYLSAVYIIDRCATSYYFQFPVLGNHSRHFGKHLKRVASMLKNRTLDGGYHSISKELCLRTCLADNDFIQQSRFNFHYYCLGCRECGDRQIPCAISYGGNLYEVTCILSFDTELSLCVGNATCHDGRVGKRAK